MVMNKVRLASVICILALFGVTASFAAAPAKSDYTATAVAVVNTMAKGGFTAAEAGFTDQMKQGVPPDKLQQIWNALTVQAGAFQKTGVTKTVQQDDYDTVVVNTEFKNRTIGFAVTFDSFGKIAGLHLVPAN